MKIQINFILLRIIKLFVFGFWPLVTLSAETVHLQLRWHHQFQFAGYYAALEKGFYQDAGLDVVIYPGSPGRLPVGQVLSGAAQYGVANSELLLARLRGQALVALAAVYQHSPSVLLARKDEGIFSPHDLVGKKVMMMEQSVDADFVAMLHNEDIDFSRVEVIQSSFNIQDLVDKKVAAFNSYLSNEPFYLQQVGVDFTVLNPRDYGVDFYSDTLFTTEAELKYHPDRVEAFRNASLKGWRYALQHKDEIIDLIIDKYKTPKSRAHLEFEAKIVETLILPDIVEIGHMNFWRWQRMSETFVQAKMVDKMDELEGFVYKPDSQFDETELKQYILISVSISVVTGLIAVVLFYAYRTAKCENKLRLAAEAEIKKMAFYDSLTGLNNRHNFFILAGQALKMAQRERAKVSIVFFDLNDFKKINDSFGHKVGDQVLVHVGSILNRFIRKSDVAARIGGDEFVLLLNHIVTDHDTQRLLFQVSQELKQPLNLQGHQLHLTASFGVATYPEDGDNIDVLLDIADTRMYDSKFKKKATDNLDPY